MQIPAVGPSIDPSLGGSAQADGALGKDAFLHLLVTQLANQNPLSPVQDQEFVAQLAQFSSLEQLENLNSTMNASVLLTQSLNNSLATNLIGKEVLITGSRQELASTGEGTWQITLAGEGDVTASVRDASGAVVRTIAVGRKGAGAHEIVWDGLDDSGARVPEGTYELEVTAVDSSGSSVAVETKVRALVTGVRFIDGLGYLMLGDVSLPLGSVVEVVQPRNQS
jgi:flagellar basal-body rod modification protein FlgD